MDPDPGVEIVVQKITTGTEQKNFEGVVVFERCGGLLRGVVVF